MRLADLIKTEAVFLRFDTDDKNAILNELVRACCAAEGLSCLDEVLQAVLDREADRSTGIGRGLAVPHCRADAVSSFHIGVAVLREGVDWGSFDGRPVHFIFLVIGPSDQPEAYLQLLSQISRLMRVPQVGKRLVGARTPEEVAEIIAEM